MGETLASTLAEINRAWNARDWVSLEEQTQIALKQGRAMKLQHEDINSLATRYLAACLRSGEFILEPNQLPDSILFKIKSLESWCAKDAAWLLTIPSVQAMHEIILLSTSSLDADRCKVASALRKIARPDLAIQVSDSVLVHSRLNYYALATKGAAHTDLNEFDAAIGILKEATRPFHPRQGKDRPLNALSRALRLRGLATGEVGDLEGAADAAAEAFAICPSLATLRTFIAAVEALEDTELVEQLNSLMSSYVSAEMQLSTNAARQALAIIRRAQQERSRH